MVLCFPPNLFPASASVLPRGALVGCSSQSWVRRAVPVGCPCVLPDTQVPMTWLGCHWCFFPTSYIFLDPIMFLTCFAFLLPELFSAPLHSREKRDRSRFFPGQQDLLSSCRDTIMLSHFLESFFTQRSQSPVAVCGIIDVKAGGWGGVPG